MTFYVWFFFNFFIASYVSTVWFKSSSSINKLTLFWNFRIPISEICLFIWEKPAGTSAQNALMLTCASGYRQLKYPFFLISTSSGVLWRDRQKSLKYYLIQTARKAILVQAVRKEGPGDFQRWEIWRNVAHWGEPGGKWRDESIEADSKKCGTMVFDNLCGQENHALKRRRQTGFVELDITFNW